MPLTVSPRHFRRDRAWRLGRRDERDPVSLRMKLATSSHSIDPSNIIGTCEPPAPMNSELSEPVTTVWLVRHPRSRGTVLFYRSPYRSSYRTGQHTTPRHEWRLTPYHWLPRSHLLERHPATTLSRQWYQRPRGPAYLTRTTRATLRGASRLLMNVDDKPHAVFA